MGHVTAAVWPHFICRPHACVFVSPSGETSKSAEAIVF